MTKLVAAAVASIAVLAVADAVRQAVRAGSSPEPRRPHARLTSWRIDRGPPPCRSLVRDACGRYRVAGGAVERSGRPHLDARLLGGAFPGDPAGRVRAVRLADGFGGSLAVAVRDSSGRGAVEIWRRRRIVGSVPLAPSAFAGGLGFSPGGHLVAAFDARGRPTLYDLRGNEVAVAGDRRPG